MIGDERRRREIVIERSEETGPNLQAFRMRVIEVHATRCSRIAFAEKCLTGSMVLSYTSRVAR